MPDSPQIDDTIAPFDDQTDIPPGPLLDNPVDIPLKQKKKIDHRYARSIHELGYIYAIFGAFDGFNLSCSMMKWMFDVFYSEENVKTADVSDAMHNWLLTPEGIAVAVIEAVALIGFSLIANVLKDDAGCGLLRMEEVPSKADQQAFDKSQYILTPSGCYYYHKSSFFKSSNALRRLELDSEQLANLRARFPENENKLSDAILDEITTLTGHTRPKHKFWRFLAVIWPYVRDVMKSLKNAYKGVRSTLFVMSMLRVQDLQHLLLPVGVALGVLSVLNRLWLRRVREQRKDMMQATADILAEIKTKKLADFDEDAYAAFHTRVMQQSQSARLSRMAYASAAYGGLVDGPYLYLGLFSLAVPQMFILMATFSILYSALLIAARVYEEHGYQRKLDLARAKVELALLGKKIEKQFDMLQCLSDPMHEGHEAACAALLAAGITVEEKQKQLWAILESNDTGLLNDFTQKRSEVQALMRISYGSAALAGVSNGLLAYGVIASMAFAVGTILALSSSIVFPPLFLTLCVSAGMAFLIVSLAHALHKHHAVRREEKKIEENSCGLLKLSRYPTELGFDALYNLLDAYDGLVQYEAVTTSKNEAGKEVTTKELKLFYVHPKKKVLTPILEGTQDFGTLNAMFSPTILLNKAERATQGQRGMIKDMMGRNKSEPFQTFRIAEQVKRCIKEGQKLQADAVVDARSGILGGMDLDPSPQYVFQEMFEVGRALGAGPGKSNSMVGLALNPLQEENHAHHYQATETMGWLALAGGVLYGFVLALRAYARGFGKSSPGAEVKTGKIVNPQPLATAVLPTPMRALDAADHGPDDSDNTGALGGLRMTISTAGSDVNDEGQPELGLPLTPMGNRTVDDTLPSGDPSSIEGGPAAAYHRPTSSFDYTRSKLTIFRKPESSVSPQTVSTGLSKPGFHRPMARASSTGNGFDPQTPSHSPLHV